MQLASCYMQLNYYDSKVNKGELTCKMHQRRLQEKPFMETGFHPHFLEMIIIFFKYSPYLVIITYINFLPSHFISMAQILM